MRLPKPPKVPPSPFRPPARDDPAQRARIMGQILAHLFGDDVFARLFGAHGRKSLQYLIKADPSQVPKETPTIAPKPVKQPEAVEPPEQPETPAESKPAKAPSTERVLPKPPKVPPRGELFEPTKPVEAPKATAVQPAESPKPPQTPSPRQQKLRREKPEFIYGESSYADHVAASEEFSSRASVTNGERVEPHAIPIDEYNRLPIVYRGVHKDSATGEHVFITTDPHLAAIHGTAHAFRLLPGARIFPDPEVEEEAAGGLGEDTAPENVRGMDTLNSGSAIVSRADLGPVDYDEVVERASTTRSPQAPEKPQVQPRSISADEAHDKIQAAVEEGGKTPDAAKNVTDVLYNMSVPQMQELSDRLTEEGTLKAALSPQGEMLAQRIADKIEDLGGLPEAHPVGKRPLTDAEDKLFHETLISARDVLLHEMKTGAIPDLWSRQGDVSPEDINSALCDIFADRITEQVPGTESKWIGDIVDLPPGVDPAEYGHKVVIYKGRYYDAEATEGVDYITQLPWYQRSGLPEAAPVGRRAGPTRGRYTPKRGPDYYGEAVGGVTQEAHEFITDWQDSPTAIPSENVVRELGKYVPDEAVVLYRGGAAGEHPLESWSHDEETAAGFVEEGEHLEKNTWQPDEVLLDFTKLPQEYRDDLEANGMGNALKEVVISRGPFAERLKEIRGADRKEQQSKQLEKHLMSLREQMAKAAQEEYDGWEQDEDGDDDMCGGGICDTIAEHIGSIIAEHIDGAELREGGHEGDDHAWTIVQIGDRAFGVDIHPSVYETGGGYSWKKIPDVEITPDDIDIFPVDVEELDEDVYPVGKEQQPETSDTPIDLGEGFEVNLEQPAPEEAPQEESSQTEPEWGTIPGVKMANGVIDVRFNREVTSEEAAKRAAEWLKAIPKRELQKANIHHIEIYENPEDVLDRLQQLGINAGTGFMVRGAFDADTGTLYASTWDGHKHSPRTLFHEIGHSALGMDEDGAESWAQAYMPAEGQQEDFGEELAGAGKEVPEKDAQKVRDIVANWPHLLQTSNGGVNLIKRRTGLDDEAIWSVLNKIQDERVAAHQEAAQKADEGVQRWIDKAGFTVDELAEISGRMRADIISAVFGLDKNAVKEALRKVHEKAVAEVKNRPPQPDDYDEAELRERLRGMDEDGQQDEIIRIIGAHARDDGDPQIHGMHKAEHVKDFKIGGIVFSWPESEENAAVETLRFYLTGDMPDVLRKASRRVVFSSGTNKDDPHWRAQWNSPDHVSYATGGDGDICAYNTSDEMGPDYGEEALGLDLGQLSHEAGHNLAYTLWGDTQPKWDSEYARAALQETPVTEYGAHNGSEDFAEACRLYTTHKDYLQKNFPAKFEALDKIMRGDVPFSGAAPTDEDLTLPIHQTDITKLSKEYQKFIEGDGEEIIGLEDVEPYLGTKYAGLAALRAFTIGSFVEINTRPDHPASKAMMELVNSLPDTKSKRLLRVMAFYTPEERDGFLKSLGEVGDVYTQNRTFASWNDVSKGTVTGDDLAAQFGEHKVILQLDNPKGAKDITPVTDGEQQEGWEILTKIGDKVRYLGFKKEGDVFVVVMESASEQIPPPTGKKADKEFLEQLKEHLKPETAAQEKAKEDYKKNGVRAKSFKNWFGRWDSKDPEERAKASKVVDPATGEPDETEPIPGLETATGKPRVMFHGSPWNRFGKFDKSKIAGGDPDMANELLFGPGFYFSDNEAVVADYKESGSGYVTPPKVEWKFPRAEVAQKILDSVDIESLEGGLVRLQTESDELNERLNTALRLGIDADSAEMVDLRNELKDARDEFKEREALYDFVVHVEQAQRFISEERAAGSLSEGAEEIALDFLDRSPELLNLMGDKIDELGTIHKGHIFKVYLNIRNPFDGKKDKLSLLDIIKKKDVLDSLDPETRRNIDKDVEKYKKWKRDLKEAQAELREDPSNFGLGGRVEHLEEHIKAYKSASYGDLVMATGSKTRANELLQKLGYDGITHEASFGARGGRRIAGVDSHRVWIAFEPNQVKEVENEGLFNPDDDDIAKSLRRNMYIKRLKALGIYSKAEDQPAIPPSQTQQPATPQGHAENPESPAQTPVEPEEQPKQPIPPKVPKSTLFERDRPQQAPVVQPPKQPAKPQKPVTQPPRQPAKPQKPKLTNAQDLALADTWVRSHPEGAMAQMGVRDLSMWGLSPENRTKIAKWFRAYFLEGRPIPKSVEVKDQQQFEKILPPDSPHVQAAYDSTNHRLIFNADAPIWRNPEAHAKEQQEAFRDGLISSGDPLHPLAHEYGHFLHNQAIGDIKYQFGSQLPLSTKEAELAKEQVSKYASYGRGEFVAEVYAAADAGRTFGPEVMKVYEQYGGPPLPQKTEKRSWLRRLFNRR